jgi:hypothetical protein
MLPFTVQSVNATNDHFKLRYKFSTPHSSLLLLLLPRFRALVVLHLLLSPCQDRLGSPQLRLKLHQLVAQSLKK